MVGGEAMGRGWLRAWRRQHPGVAVVHHYGPTEATVGCTDYLPGEADTGGAGPVPIGRPMANTRVFVLDGWLGPEPVGGSGELYVAGGGLARGGVGRVGGAEGGAVGGVPVRVGGADVPDGGSGPVDGGRGA